MDESGPSVQRFIRRRRFWPLKIRLQERLLKPDCMANDGQIGLLQQAFLRTPASAYKILIAGNPQTV